MKLWTQKNVWMNWLKRFDFLGNSFYVYHMFPILIYVLKFIQTIIINKNKPITLMPIPNKII